MFYGTDNILCNIPHIMFYSILFDDFILFYFLYY